ncbi:MAG: 2-oxoacid:acceptor oxidoreductase subunit alpha, partial [Candidatus Electryoneaceae bacterium]|nr:2-oxoacid:acceptor oxidoreductase subunit alpha [Candidatus Electryoneaceae bacterium]
MSEKEQKQRQVVFWQGNHVVAEAAIAAGCRFFAGYPITPSSEVAHIMSARLPQEGGKFIQMEDEIAAMGAVIGASLTGLKVMTATSGPGFSLKQENIGYACMIETPCVVVNVMRGGPSTGLPTALGQSDVMQARWGTHGDRSVIAITPSYLNEVYREMIRAFNLAERFRMPIYVLLDEVLGHLSERLDIPDPSEYELIDRVRPTVPPEEYVPYDSTDSDVPPMADYFTGYRWHTTGLNHDRTGFPTTNPDICQAENERIMSKVHDHLDEIEKYEEYLTEDAEIGVVAFGSTARAAFVAVNDAREKGIKAGLLRPITLWPYPEEATAKLGSQVKAIVVPEASLGQMIFEIERVAHCKGPVVGVNKV